jgi:outer membrane protein OmpA-like peptidoglycan-associated protein
MKQHILTTLYTFVLAIPFLTTAQSAGLIGEYYNGTNFEQKVLTRTDRAINFTWDNVAPAPGMNSNEFSIRWKGQIKAPKTGVYEFSALVDDGIRVKVNGQSVITAWGLNDNKSIRGKITLQEGRLYDLEVDYFNGMVEGEIRLFWQVPGDEPTFGGVFGYNDKPITAEYFFQPKPATPPTPVQEKPKPPAPPKPKPQTNEKTKPPVAKPTTTPTSTALKDSIEWYKPKNIQFEQSKSVMLSGSEIELDRLAAFLVRYPQLKVTIEGHTDQVGKPEQNLKLSQNRANKVAEYLKTKGVAATRITAIGYGDTRPLKDKSKDVAQNRRVAFIIQ